MKTTGFVVTAAAILAGTGASAALIDFTDNSIYTTKSGASAAGSVAGIGFTVTGSTNKLTFTTKDAPGAIGVLAGDNDGIGLGNDEIGGVEYLTVTFDRAVKITSLFFLDLFRNPDNSSTETALLYSGVPPTGGNFALSFDAVEDFAPGGFGYGAFGANLTGMTFSFDTGAGNDGIGIGDFALAGLELDAVDMAPIPLPAGALLLGTGLLGLARFRRK